MQGNFSVIVGGVPLSFIPGYWGGAVLTTRRRGGSWSLSWSMEFPGRRHHPALVRGASVVAKVGPARVFRGYLTEPDFDTMEFVADGSCRQAENAVATNLTGPTSDPSEAIFYASSRGVLDWGGLETFAPVTTSGTTDAANTIADLLDRYAADVGRNWAVDTDGLVYTYSDDTSPSWAVRPGVGVLGVADDDYFTGLVGTYRNKAGKYQQVYASDPNPQANRRERRVDLTGLGRTTGTRALATLNAMLAQGISRTGWTNGVQVSTGQIFTMGGTPVSLALPRAGQMLHLAGLYDERGVTHSTNVVLDETIWNVSEDTLQLNPVGLADRDLASIIEARGGVLL